MAITYIIFNCFLDFGACFVNSRVQERSKVLCTLCNLRCDCCVRKKREQKRNIYQNAQKNKAKGKFLRKEIRSSIAANCK